MVIEIYKRNENFISKIQKNLLPRVTRSGCLINIYFPLLFSDLGYVSKVLLEFLAYQLKTFRSKITLGNDLQHNFLI